MMFPSVQRHIKNEKHASYTYSLFSYDLDGDSTVGYIFGGASKLPSFVFKHRRETEFRNFSNQYEQLKSLHQTDDLGECLEAIPRPIMCAPVGLKQMYVETYVSGKHLSNRRVFTHHNFELVVDWLTSFHQKTASYDVLSDRDAMLRYFIPESDPESRMPGCDKVDKFYSDRLSHVDTLALPLVFYHGDFAPYNILIDGESVGVIDWEYAKDKYLPVLDLINLFSYAHFSKKKRDFGDSYRKAFIAKSSFSIFCQNQMSKYLKTMNIDASLLDLYIVSYLLHTIPLKKKHPKIAADMTKIVYQIIEGS